MIRLKAVKARALVLTFDDGPGDRLTHEILDLLDKNRAKVTFCVLGKNVKGREAIVREIAERGHDIFSHGYDHLDAWKTSPIRTISDINRGWEAIDEALGKEQRVYPFRPVGGRLNLISLFYLLYRRVPIVLWTVDSSDTWAVEIRDSQLSAKVAAESGGAVVLIHDFDRVNDEDWNKMVIETIKVSFTAAREKKMNVMPLSELFGNHTI